MSFSHDEIYEWIERPGGPALIAYWNDGDAASEYGDQGTREYDWHTHRRGQFHCV